MALDPDHAMTYLSFVEERHRIWARRQAGEPGPWTDDPVLASRKFTNVFRILDPGTQFVLTDLLDPELPDEDNLMRCFLYRSTGRIEAWEWLQIMTGDYPVIADLDTLYETWMPYRGEPKKAVRYPWVLGKDSPVGPKESLNYPRTVFTGAYLVHGTPGKDKLQSQIDITRSIFSSDLTAFFGAEPRRQFQVLKKHHGVGDFVTMQALADWWYVHEPASEYVVPGPGAGRGAKILDPKAKPEVTLKRAQELVLSSAGCPSLHGREPSLMDIQNTLCEFGKYMRFSGKPVPKKTYQPAHPGPQKDLVLPGFTS